MRVLFAFLLSFCWMSLVAQPAITDGTLLNFQKSDEYWKGTALSLKQFFAGLSGTGTANYLPKFSGASTLTTSQLFDDGTSVGLNGGTFLTAGKFEVAKSYSTTTNANIVVTGNVPLIGFRSTSDRWAIGHGYVSGTTFSLLHGSNADPSFRVLDISSNGDVLTGGRLTGNTMSTTAFGNSFGSSTVPTNVSNYFYASGSTTGRNRFQVSSSTLYLDLFCNQSSGRNYTFANNYFAGTDLALLRSTTPSGLPGTLVWMISDEGYFGFGTSGPTQPVDFSESIRIRSTIFDVTNSSGSTGNLAVNTGAGFQWQSIVTALGGSVFLQNGNSFAAAANIGTNDDNDLRFETNNTYRGRFDNGGSLIVGGATTDEATDKMRVMGGARADYLVLNNKTGDPDVNAGQVEYHTNASPDAHLSFGDGSERKVIFTHSIDKEAIDYNVNWVTGRTRSFFTVPAKYNGMKIRRVTLAVSTVGTGTNTIVIEKGGSTQATQNITLASHSITINQTMATDDIWTFNVTAISGTPTKGLTIQIEITQ